MAYKFIAPLRHMWLVFSAETKRLVTYRAQFWFELILSSIIELMVAIAVWQAVFSSSGKTQIAGFTFRDMLLYVTVTIFFSQATKGTGVGTFQREVYEGSLTKYLIFPLSIFSYKLGTFLPRSMFAVFQLILALAFIYLLGYWAEGQTLNFANIILGLFALILACLLYFFVLVCLESLAFWADNVWALSYALQIAIVFLSGKAIPLEMFPSWAGHALQNSPFPYFAYIPAQILLGKIPVDLLCQTFVIEIIWLLIFYLLSKLLIRQGLYQYTGVGQ